MQFSEQWLRSLVNPGLDSAALSHLLTMAGLEVEASEPVAADFRGVVVAAIVATEKHPSADKLKVCRVDAGQGELLQIVCGAPNAEAGMKVPLAMVGAILPGITIKAAKLRGVESFGMLCSARELGLSSDHAGLLALPADAVPGSDLRNLLDLDDIVHTIKLTPNRSDCLSLTGVARELAALTGAALSMPEDEPIQPVIDDVRKVVLDAPAACPRYCGRIVRGVNARAASPAWMKQRLERSGIRSISALVDVTNYVMLELGQPLHIFDDSKLSGDIHVRFPREGESVLLLNEQTVTPAPDTLLISDDARALALGGIMGGEDSGVTLDTVDVFLEGAFFAPDAIAGRGRAYGFSSDASHRYERGVDFELPARAIERATRLILDICGGAAGPVVEALALEHLPVRKPVRVRPARVRRVLGIDLSDETMAGLLASVHLTVARDDQGLVVTPPSFRFDIEVEEDLIEEIARLHGYEAIPALPPRGTMAMLESSETARSGWSVRRLLAARDYQEVINYAFVDAAWERDLCGNDEPLRLANPIASQMSVMRTSLIPGLIANLAENRKHQQARIRVFEAGRCFERAADGAPVSGFQQPLRIAALAAGGALPEQWGAAHRAVDFYDVKSDVEALLGARRFSCVAHAHPALHPGRSAAIMVEGRKVGVLGEVHPVWVERYELGCAPVVFELDMDVAIRAAVPAYREFSRLPVVARDLALVVDATQPADAVLDVLRRCAPEMVRSVALFDVYHGKGIDPDKKSLAFRVLMQDTQRTLEDADVDAAMAVIIRGAESALGARLRG